MFRFRNRTQAGRYVAEGLTRYAGISDGIVLGLPRGGVVVAHEVAKKLGLPLDVFLVRKLGVPGYEELAMGAIASGGVWVLNEDVLQQISISREEIEAAVRRETHELERRAAAYRGNRPPLDAKGMTVILVDDGLATGATMRAAVAALRKQNPKRIVIAVPAGAPDVCSEFRSEVDDVLCVITPMPFQAVGVWYEDFSQTTDEEVKRMIHAG